MHPSLFILFAAAIVSNGIGAGPKRGVSRKLDPAASPAARAGFSAPAPPVCGQNNAPCPSAMNVTYSGGQVIANPKVYVVRWGSSVAVPNGGDLGGFFKTILNSPYLDWLAEYDTTLDNVGNVGRSDKRIGRGVFAGDFTITPSVAKKILSQNDALGEIDAQISTGKLPSPEASPTSLNTMYMIHFSPGQYECQLDQLITDPTQPFDQQGHKCDGTFANCFCAANSNDPARSITLTTPAAPDNPCCPWSQGSCTAFCAYHGFFPGPGVSGTNQFYYGIMPDFSSNELITVPNGKTYAIGCAIITQLSPPVSGCGGGTNFQNLNSASSHELLEAVTDAQVNLVDDKHLSLLGWYDNGAGEGEIGDMCNQVQDFDSFAPNYAVQQVLSEQVWNTCHATPATCAACVSNRQATNDFAISFDGSVPDVPRGGSVAVQISSTVHGTPGTIALSLPTAAPAAGVTASLTRTSLDHVDSTTLVLSAKSDAALTPDVGGTGVPVPMVVASGSAGSVTHTASLLFHVTAPAASDFSIVVTPDAEIVPTGSTGAAYSVQTSLVNGSADAITLSTTTLPAGVSAFADHNPVPAGETALVTLLAAPTARLGQFNFSIVGTGAGGVSHSAPSSGTVLLANDFHLAVTPMRAVSVAGAGSTLQATYSIATAVVSGSSEPVTLSVHGLPPHATASFSPGSTITSSGGSATLTVTADSTATSSTGSLTVVGTSASQPVGYSQSVAFAVDLPPTASVDAPANGSQVSGTVAISASAHAGEGSSLASLTLEIDGATPAGAATATSSPLHFSWDTTQTSNGSHTLAVAATDADGATTKSGAVTVTVANAPVSTSPSVNGSGGDTSKGGGCATGPDFAAAAGGVALLFLRRRRRTVF